MKEQEFTFHREVDNDFDRFAVAGKTLLPGKVAPSIVGHAPRKLSRYTLPHGTIITAEVKLGELEILIEMSIVWDDTFKMKKTRNCSNRVLYRPKQRNFKRNEG